MSKNDKITDTLNVPNVDMNDVVEKKKTKSPKKKKTKIEKNNKDKEKEDLKKEVKGLFSKDTELQKNIKNDNETLRNYSLAMINKIDTLLETMMTEITQSITHSEEMIKSFSLLLKNYNDISNSLSKRNTEMMNHEVDMFKEKLALLDDFFRDKLKEVEKNDDSANNKEMKSTLQDILEKIEEAS